MMLIWPMIFLLRISDEGTGGDEHEKEPSTSIAERTLAPVRGGWASKTNCFSLRSALQRTRGSAGCQHF